MKNITATKIETLKKLGNVWEKNGMSRIYFDRDDLAAAINIDADFSKSGSMRSFYMDGDKFSNTKGTEIWNALNGMYIDLNTGKFGFKNDFFGHGTMIIEALESFLESQEPAVEETVVAEVIVEEEEVAVEADGTFDNYIVTITVDLNTVGDLECVDESEFESELHDAIADKFEAEFGTRPHVTSGSETIATVEPSASNTDFEIEELESVRDEAREWFEQNFMTLVEEVLQAA